MSLSRRVLRGGDCGLGAGVGTASSSSESRSSMDWRSRPQPVQKPQELGPQALKSGRPGWSMMVGADMKERAWLETEGRRKMDGLWTRSWKGVGGGAAFCVVKGNSTIDAGYSPPLRRRYRAAAFDGSAMIEETSGISLSVSAIEKVSFRRSFSRSLLSGISSSDISAESSYGPAEFSMGWPSSSKTFSVTPAVKE